MTIISTIDEIWIPLLAIIIFGTVFIASSSIVSSKIHHYFESNHTETFHDPSH